MRSLVPWLLALACPIGMCLGAMLLARRKGGDRQAGCMKSGSEKARKGDVGSLTQGEQKELHRLRTEVEALRAELAVRRVRDPATEDVGEHPA